MITMYIFYILYIIYILWGDKQKFIIHIAEHKKRSEDLKTFILKKRFFIKSIFIM